MTRRSFLSHLLCAASALIAGKRIVIAARRDVLPLPQKQVHSGRFLELRGEYYRHYPVDFSRGPLGAQGFLGWGESEPVQVPVEQTALVCMHIWNIGFHPKLHFGPSGPAGPVMEMLEWAVRSIPITRTIIPAVLAAARGAGLPVVHVASDESYARKYPGYRRAQALAGAEPAGLPRAPRPVGDRDPDSEKHALLFGPRFQEAVGWYTERLDFPEVARPREDEYVAVSTHQLHAVLRHLGVWQLIYVGTGACGFLRGVWWTCRAWAIAARALRRR